MSVLETKSRVGYYGKHYLIVPDEAAGKKFRYTVYEISHSLSYRVRIIGRELDLRTARKLAHLASDLQAKLRKH